MQVKLAYYASSITFFWPNYANIMLFFPNYAIVFLNYALWKNANKSKIYIFSLEALRLQERNATNPELISSKHVIQVGRRHIVALSNERYWDRHG